MLFYRACHAVSMHLIDVSMCLCVCVSMYLCICVSMYICICVSVYLCLYIYIYIYMYIHICLSMYLCIYVSVYARRASLDGFRTGVRDQRGAGATGCGIMLWSVRLKTWLLLVTAPGVCCVELWHLKAFETFKRGAGPTRFNSYLPRTNMRSVLIISIPKISNWGSRIPCTNT